MAEQLQQSVLTAAERQGAPGLAALLATRANDLELPARRLLPAVGEVLTALAGAPDCLIARMSGSGATCFALFETDRAAEAARDEIAAETPAWWCRATRLATGGQGEAVP